MKYLKGFNNNVALLTDDNGNEVIAMGKGISFNKLKGDYIDPVLIEKRYLFDPNSDQTNKLAQLFNSIPLEDITLAETIILHCQNKYHRKFSNNILITLSDHISFALKRAEQGIDIKNPLQWEIVHLYQEYIQIAKDAIVIIEETRHIKLPESEIFHIALNFINGEVDMGNMDETIELTEIINSIILIVEEYFHITLDSSTLNVSRFITHIKYFLLRQKRNIPETNQFFDIYQITRENYPVEFDCVDRIKRYITQVYHWECNEDEMFYLMIHINRVIARN